MEYKWAAVDRYSLLKDFARENRLHMTDAENYLWVHLMKKNTGEKFKRQYIIGDYIADFACISKHLIIEVDGGYHSEPLQIEDDVVRTAWLEKMGWKVIRFTNEEVLADINTVLNIIREHINNY